MKKTMVKGSYTVEAAFLFPLIIFVVFALCYMAFYLHDMIRIKTVLDDVIGKEGRYLKNQVDFESGTINYEMLNQRSIFHLLFDSMEEEEKKLLQYTKEKLREGIYITHINEVTGRVSSQIIEIQVIAKMKISLIPAAKYFSLCGTRVVIKSKVPVHNPSEFVRAYDALDQVICEVKGMREIKDKLKKLFEFLRTGV